MIRVAGDLRERKEEAVEKIRIKYKTKKDRLEQQLERAIVKVGKEKNDVKTKTTDSLISFGYVVVRFCFKSDD